MQKKTPGMDGAGARQGNTSMDSKTIKACAFAFIIYPDSWPEWKRELEHLHMPVVVSPLHDRDCTEDGTPKKPHRHAIISWPNPTTMRNALVKLEPFGVNHVEAVGSYQGYCRYLIHADSPEKAQYDAADIVCLNGAVADLTRKLTNSELLELRKEILAFVDENGVDEYIELIRYVRIHRPDWCEEVLKHPNFWSAVFASIRGENKADAERKAARNYPAE